MLFSDITDCEMLVYRCIQEADNEIGLVGIMDELEKKYQKDWKRSTVCTFIAHLSKNWCSMHAWLKEFQRRMQLRL